MSVLTSLKDEVSLSSVYRRLTTSITTVSRYGSITVKGDRVAGLTNHLVAVSSTQPDKSFNNEEMTSLESDVITTDSVETIKEESTSLAVYRVTSDSIQTSQLSGESMSSRKNKELTSSKASVTGGDVYNLKNEISTVESISLHYVISESEMNTYDSMTETDTSQNTFMYDFSTISKDYLNQSPILSWRW